MLHPDRAFVDATSAAVAALETRTDAEIVVVAAPRSGAYRDLQHVGAALAAALALLAVLFAPVDVPPWTVPVEVGAAYAVVYGLLGGRGPIAALASTARKRAQAETAAHDAFFRESVAGTPRHTGVLVYVSALEGAVVVVPDAGVRAVVPPGELDPVVAAWRTDDLPAFLRGLDALGEVLARRLPHRPDSDHTNLPDAPRVYA